MFAWGSDHQQVNTKPRTHRNILKAQILGLNALCRFPRSGNFPHRESFPPRAQTTIKKSLFYCVFFNLCPCACAETPVVEKHIIEPKIKQSPKKRHSPTIFFSQMFVSSHCPVLLFVKAVGSHQNKGRDAGTAPCSCTHSRGELLTSSS